jgi:hypothetical protein
VGERITVKVVNKFTSVINGYGTAETVNISVAGVIASGSDLNRVGRVNSFSQVYVLSPDLRLLPRGFIGEVSKKKKKK